MSGKIIKEIARSGHVCKGIPSIWRFFKLRYEIGTQWQCDQCSGIWEVRRTYDGMTTGREWQRAI